MHVFARVKNMESFQQDKRDVEAASFRIFMYLHFNGKFYACHNRAF